MPVKKKSGNLLNVPRKYLDLAREVKRHTMEYEFRIVIGALGTVPESLVKELENLGIKGQVETIQTTVLRSPSILRRVLELEETCGHSNSDKKKYPSANANVKNS